MKSWMKLALSLLLLLQTGCWDRTELNDLAIITALTFDKAENNQIRTTVQIFIPKTQGAGGEMGGGGGMDKTTVKRHDNGIDIANALSKLQRRIPRRLFWGQTNVFIFSEAVAKAGIREHFDYLIRHPKTRERAFIYVSKGKAEDLLDIFPPIERFSAEVLREISNLHPGIKVTKRDLSIMLKGEAGTAFLPLVRILKPPKTAEPNQTIPYAMGTAIFKKDKMIGEISEKVTRGLLWIRNEIKDYTVTFETEEGDGLVSLHSVRANVKLIPKIEGDKWKMTIRVRTQGDIVQNGTNLNPTNPKLLNILDKAFENDVRERIQLALRVIQHRLKADVLGFATAFRRKYPEQWEKNKERWEELFPQVEVKVDVKANILRPGSVNAPGGMPKEEVKQK